MIDTLVILGASGDLTGRYLVPALARLAAAGEMSGSLRVLAVDRGEETDDSFRAIARERLERHLPDLEPAHADAVLRRVSYRRADVTSADQLRDVLPELKETAAAVYLALPNAVFRPTVQALSQLQLRPGSRLIVEKPFGVDQADARRLNDDIRPLFDESEVFRVDHFLAKQTVLDILGLRFANRIFEPVWNSLHVDRVDIVWDETLALEGRAGYYDHAGALRDMVQNHLLQLLALVAMEPPTTLGERDLRDRKVDVLRAVRAPASNQMASHARRARYVAGRTDSGDVPAYVAEDGVDPARRTETYADVTLSVQNGRWAGVPFRLRSGKALGQDRQEIALHFRPAAHQPFDQHAPADVLRFSLEPDQIGLEINLNGAGDPFDLERATLHAGFAEQHLPPYSRLLAEILGGEPTLSIRGDEAEESWRIVEPILAAWASDDVPMQEYPAGSDGPGN
ncbi:glucose-6-phosphate dehydrogenase [Aquipuribacter sp. MA13-6]|uniref:glucose-6-phosphate dehydrogenase n=1 Tax=unclassified Aquipuribacter TaxID=2635084 RepID=UPI003EE940BE